MKDYEVGRYDTGRELVIDPVLNYSTYLGGSGTEEASGIALDNSGNIYIAGETNSIDFPTQGSIQAIAGSDIFVTKLNPSGSAIIYSTYIGGSLRDSGSGIVVDNSGNAYVSGSTTSLDFPTQAPVQSVFAGVYDIVIMQLNPSGTALVFSSYLGGGAMDLGNDIAIDSSGNLYLAGVTHSADFPTQNPFQSALKAPVSPFVAKIHIPSSTLVYSTYLGGGGPGSVNSSDEGANAIAADEDGNAYVVGNTRDTAFPIQNAIQPSHGGGGDVFVTKFNPSGTALIYSTYLGGSGSEGSPDLAVDSFRNVYVSGNTTSLDFPMANPIQSSLAGALGDTDGFITKINSSGSALVFSTYLGGSATDGTAGDIAVDSLGNVYVTGQTAGGSFPIVDAVQSAHGGLTDILVTKVNSSGTAWTYSTFLGGSGDDWPLGIAVDRTGSVYVTGVTRSTDFPTTGNALQSAYGGGGSDVFVAKIGPLQDLQIDGQIVFHSRRDGIFDIYDMDPDGTNLTQLTNEATDDLLPSWSPDGKKVAFLSFRGGGPFGDLFVMNADGTNLTRLTVDDIAGALSWSPDGTRIAFETSRDGNQEIYVMNADGSNPVNLTNNVAQDVSPSWSPDGSKIAFRSERNGNREIYTMNPDGTNLINLTNNAAIDRGPAWSPDGSKIAFGSDRNGNQEIYSSPK